MSTEAAVTGNKDAKGEKKVRCEITDLMYFASSQQLSCKAKLTGKIKSEDKWTIENAETTLTVEKVPLRALLVRVFVGWFWVRKVQDVLRKGTVADARIRLNKGYDWTEETTTRKEAEKAPAPIIAERALAQMSAEEIKAFLAQMNKRFNVDGSPKA